EPAGRIGEGNPATEYELSRLAKARWAQEGLAAEGGPLVAADAHPADPHYIAPQTGSAVVGRGSILLLDFATALSAPGSIPGDLTRVFFMGDKVPEEIQRVAAIVYQARDAALRLFDGGRLPTGAEVDGSAPGVTAEGGP